MLRKELANEVIAASNWWEADQVIEKIERLALRYFAPENAAWNVDNRAFDLYMEACAMAGDDRAREYVAELADAKEVADLLTGGKNG